MNADEVLYDATRTEQLERAVFAAYADFRRRRRA